MGIILICVLALADTPGQQPVAMVLRAGKGATLKSGKDDKPLDEMDLLRKGDAITTGKEGVRIVILEDGHCEQIKPGQTVTISEKGGSPRSAVEVQKTKMSNANLKQLQKFLGSQRTGATVVRRDQADAWPTPRSATFNRRPTLAWPTVTGAVKYEVRLAEGENDLWKTTTQKPILVYPRGQKPLPEGATVTWAVTAVTADDKRIPVTLQQKDKKATSDFRVAGQSAQQTFNGLEPLLSSDDPEDWLLAGLVYEGERYYEEALKLYEKAAAKRPRERNVLEALKHYYERAHQDEKAKAIEKRLNDLK